MDEYRVKKTECALGLECSMDDHVHCVCGAAAEPIRLRMPEGTFPEVAIDSNESTDARLSCGMKQPDHLASRGDAERSDLPPHRCRHGRRARPSAVQAGGANYVGKYELSRAASRRRSVLIALDDDRSRPLARHFLRHQSQGFVAERGDQWDHIVVCDRAGRLYSVYRAGVHHRRSLNGSIRRSGRQTSANGAG
jgi:hypothetical protein